MQTAIAANDGGAAVMVEAVLKWQVMAEACLYHWYFINNLKQQRPQGGHCLSTPPGKRAGGRHLTRGASPPEWGRLTSHEQTTMFRGKGGEPPSRPKVHTKTTPTQPSSTQQNLQNTKAKGTDKSGNEEGGGSDREGVSRQEKGERGGTGGQGDGRNKGVRQQRGESTSQTGREQHNETRKQR